MKRINVAMRTKIAARIFLLAALVAAGFGLTPSASAVGPGDADAAISAFNKTFLVTSGSSAYYKESLSSSKPDQTWTAALDIMGEEDVYERTGSAADKTLVNDLCATWLQNTPPGDAAKPWSWDGWNDDLGWFTMALARGYRITGNPAFLAPAEDGFKYAFSRGWDTRWNGGGIWEQQIEYCKDGSKVAKETLSNDSLGIVSCLLYQSTHEAAYLNDARQIYGWEHSHLYDAGTGQVYTSVAQDGTVDRGTAVYNQGSFVEYANLLYQMTGEAGYYRDAVRAINYTRDNLTVGGVLSNSAGYGKAWADMFARGLGHFVRDNHQWGAYYPWMVQNANAAWGCRRTDDNIAWNGWAEQTPTDNTLVTPKFVSAVAWLQYTPATLPGRIAGVHTIVSKQNGIAIDSGGGFTSSPSAIASVVERSLNRGVSQRWSFTQNADSSWSIISESSWQALDDPAGSTANGTKMIQWPLSRDSNQRWLVNQQPDGSFTICNQVSGLLLDNSRSAVNGQALVQRVRNGRTQQLWVLR